mgnify:CR=1 FL=1
MKYFFSLFIGLFFLSVNAQNYMDLIRMSYANTPLNDFNNNEGQTRLEELGLELNFPIVLNKKATLLSGITASSDNLKFDSNVSGYTSLYSIRFLLGLNQIYSDKWSGTYVLLPKIASDLNKISKEDFQLGFLSLLTYSKRVNLKYKIGLYVNTEKYGPLAVPLFGLYYKSLDKKFETNLTLPGRADINYQLFGKTNFGVNFQGFNSSYNLNKPIYDGSGNYIVKSSNELFAYLTFQLGKSIYLKTNAGYSISRTYKIFDNKDKVNLALSSIYFGDSRSQLNTNFEKGIIFKLELIYRFDFK